MDSGVNYYERRAVEYDATSWESAGGDPLLAQRVRNVVAALPARRTLDVGCGTGYVSRWLPGSVTLLDSSAAMLAIARERLPNASAARALAPSLPFVDGSFERAFTANLYGHLVPSARARLLEEMLRVAGEVVVLEQLADDGVFSEGSEIRRLTDGSTFTIHKCYFTVDRLLEELGGGEVLSPGPFFAIVRRHR